MPIDHIKAKALLTTYTAEQKVRLKRVIALNFYMSSRQGEVQLRNVYGLTKNDIHAMLILQDCHCDCCGVGLDTVKKWAIDHNHRTLANRGIVCYSCNVGIGMLGGDIIGLRRGVAYLTRHGET